jgi:hypothetical protein
MRAAKLAFAGIFLIGATCLFTQTLVEKLYVMRTDTTTVDPYSGMTRTCVVVFPDGRYRMERTFQGTQGGTPETKVFVDTLPADVLKNLETVLDNDDLQSIKTEPSRGGIIQNMDMLALSVPREHTVQNIQFETAMERRPFEKGLKPFLNSLKMIEKRKVAASKNEKSNNCEAPRVMYRTEFHPDSKPESDSQ